MHQFHHGPIPFLVIVFLTSATLLHAVEQCVKTENTCQCEVTANPDPCYETLGNGTCLSKPCNAGYVCSCEGYLICSAHKCDAYYADEMPSALIPFSCTKANYLRSCLTPAGLIDTFAGATEAEKNAISNYDLMNSAVSAILDYVVDIRGFQRTIDPFIANVEKRVDDEKKDALSTIYGNAFVIDKALRDVSQLNYFATSDLQLSREWVRKARLSKEMAEESYKNATATMTEIEKEKSKDVIDGALLSKLQQQYDSFELAKKTAAKECAQRAVDVGMALAKLENRIDTAAELKATAQEASNETINTYQAIMT